MLKCDNCGKDLPPTAVAEGRCKNCGETIPHIVKAPEKTKRARPQRESSEQIRTDLPVPPSSAIGEPIEDFVPENVEKKKRISSGTILVIVFTVVFGGPVALFLLSWVMCVCG